MSQGTNYHNLYVVLGQIVTDATGRPWRKKRAIKSRPKTAYCAIHITEGEGVENDIVEIIELETPLETGETLQQRPWGCTLLTIEVDFYKDTEESRADDAANQLKLALSLEERQWDLWKICGLSGGIDIFDLSTPFRNDIEGRAKLRFRAYANLALPLPKKGTNIFDIDTLHVDIKVQKNDGSQEVLPVDVENDQN